MLEIIIFAVVALVVVALIVMYTKNTKKIKAQPKEEPKPTEEPKKEETPSTQPATPKAVGAKKIMEEVNDQAEQYIKTSLLEDDKPKKSKFSESVQFEEVSEVELEKDDKEDDNGAIVLGVKKQNVHILDDLDTQENHENSTSILQDMDSDSDQWVISEKYTNVMSVEDLDDNNDDVKQEFNSLSKRMKVLMVTNAFGKKQDK
ncbi:MAG: hypothetical protein MR288_03060 [Firmicutes bacterium]|nr:hypothetical protein [Bacillota bacterium]